MPERTVGLEVEKAYAKVKALLLEKGCTIVAEEPTSHISIKHGSLRGVSPKSAKKEVSYHLFPKEAGTRIVSYSSVASDWATLTFWGNVLAAIIAGIFWWIASDLEAFISNQTAGYWIWLARAFGYPDINYMSFMINLTKILSIVLVVTIILEIADVVYVYSKIDRFADETLSELPK